MARARIPTLLDTPPTVLSQFRKSEEYSNVTGLVGNILKGSFDKKSNFEDDYWSDDSAKVEFEICKKEVVFENIDTGHDFSVIDIDTTTAEVVANSTVTFRTLTAADSDEPTNFFNFLNNIVVDESEIGSGN